MSTESRKEILDLLASGKINVDEAAEMLSQVKEDAAPATSAAAPEPVTKATPAAKVIEVTTEEAKVKNGHPPTWFHVRVSNLETGKSKVSVNIPLRMFKLGFTLAKRFTPEVNGLDMEELQSTFNEGGSGIIVDVQDEENNEHVQIYID